MKITIQSAFTPKVYPEKEGIWIRTTLTGYLVFQKIIKKGEEYLMLLTNGDLIKPQKFSKEGVFWFGPLDPHFPDEFVYSDSYERKRSPIKAGTDKTK